MTELLQLSALAVVFCKKPVLIREEQIDKDFEEFGPDAIGLYYPEEPAIAIDRKKCGEHAKRLKVDAADIEKVVLIHELAHYVTHRGTGFWSGLDWKGFADPIPNPIFTRDKERMAQGFTYLWIKRFGNDELFNVFDLLSKGLPVYRDWENDLLGKDFAVVWFKMVKDLHETSRRIQNLSSICKLLDNGLDGDVDPIVKI